MTVSPLRFGIVCLALILLAGVDARHPTSAASVRAESDAPGEQLMQERTMKVHYLEIVTTSVDETCAALAGAHGVEFGEPIAELGNARTARMEDGALVGVRAPMHDGENGVVRPYVLVKDIDAAVAAAESAGAQVAMPPTEIPGHGTFAIYLLGGIQHGFWQL
jgi:predicted enzyme related to lactoylglutathione lyase